MLLQRQIFDEDSTSKRFLKSYCGLCIILFFKALFSESTFVDIFLVLSFIICIFNFSIYFFALIFSLKRNKQIILNSLYLLSFLITSVRATALFFARINQSKPGLIWNVDIGFSLSHAQNIFRHGHLRNSISMDGFPEAYHIGPSYIAGIIPRYFGISLDFIALFLLPLIFVSCFIIVSKLIINSLVNNYKIEKSLSILLCITPGLFLNEPNLKNILENDLDLFWSKLIYNLPFHIPAMHNSMMAASAFLCIFYLLITSFKKNLYLILITSLSLSTIKPLYFVSSFVIIALYSVLLLIYNYKYKIDEFKNELKFLTKFQPVFFSTIIISIWFYIYKINSVAFYKVSISFSILKDFIRSLESLSFKELKYTLWPVHNTIIYLPILSCLIVIILIIIKFKKGLNLDNKARFFIDLCFLIFMASTCMYFFSLAFSLYYEVTDKSNILLGLIVDQIPNNYGEYLILESQASYPLYTLLSIIGSAYIVKNIKSNHFPFRYSSRLIPNFFLIFTILFNFIHTSFLVTKENYVNKKFSIDRDEIDETNYRKLVQTIPVENSLLLSNTVEEGFYGRHFRNTYLTAYTPHSHFLANIYDYHWRSGFEAPRRVDIYKKIFPNKIDMIGIYNPDSIEIIKENNISHLLLKKITSNEKFNEFKGIKLLNENKSWALFKVIY